MTTLYLHGLESKLNEVKRNILEKHSLVIAPDMDYRGNDKIFDLITEIVNTNKVDAIVGSSMGGLMGYNISKMFNIPALIFNPALPFASVGQIIPVISAERTAHLKIIIGGKDEIISPLDNFNWIVEREKGDYEIKWINLLGHQNPPEVFKTEVDEFFQRLKVIR